MDKKEIFNLYEKLYFHEIDSKNQISNRLQISLAILISYASVYAYLFKQTDLEITFWCFFYIVVMSISVVLYGISIHFFKCAFFGHTYEMLPRATETEKYRKILIEQYKPYKRCEEYISNYLDDYIYRYFNECSSINTAVNDYRSNSLHYSNKFILYNLISLALAFIVFCSAGIDKDETKKQIDVKIVNPIQLK